MSDVVQLPGTTRKPGRGQPNPDLVGALERYLGEARRGEITSAGFAIVTADGLAREGFTIAGNDVNSTIAAATMLQYRIAKWVDEFASAAVEDGISGE